MVQFGMSGGHDVALWTPDAKPSAIACLDYSTASNHDNFYACANGINNGVYAYIRQSHIGFITCLTEEAPLPDVFPLSGPGIQ